MEEGGLNILEEIPCLLQRFECKPNRVSQPRPSIGGVCFKYRFIPLDGDFSPLSYCPNGCIFKSENTLLKLLIFTPGQQCKPGLSQVNPDTRHFSSQGLALNSLVL